MDTLSGDPGASLFFGGLASRLDAFDQLLLKAARHFPEIDSLLRGFNLNGRGLLLTLLALFLLLLLPLTEWIMRRAGNVKPNFRGETIPQSAGLAVVLFAAVSFAAAAYLIPGAVPDVMTWLLAIAGFGGLGLLDDMRGDRTIRGLRGHFRAAFLERKITTGFVKAVGGLLFSLVIGLRLCPESFIFALFSAGIIALSANAVNLLDLRPGRAGSVFLLFAVPLIALTLRTGGNAAGVPLLLFVAIPALGLYPKDAAAHLMLGDTGSNPLGAALALAFLEMRPLLFAQIIVLLLLLGLHLIAERASLTALIEKNSVLRKLDRLTGIRE